MGGAFFSGAIVLEPFQTSLKPLYEKLMYNQLYDYFDNILFPSQCGFRKGYTAQHCLLIKIKKFNEAFGRRNELGAVQADLSKVFDYINHHFL